MPRTESIREVLDADIYDCFNPRELAIGITSKYPRPAFNPADLAIGFAPKYPRPAPSDGTLHMFGNRNIGNLFRTNMQVAGLAACDASFVVTNWRARTNVVIDDRFASQWHAWTNATIATFVIGCQPQVQVPLCHLLENKGQLGQLDDAMIESLAKRLAGDEWDSADATTRSQWWALADHSMTVLGKRHWIIPVRQNFGVTITSNQRALGALLEVMPTNVAPASLVWIHLEGHTVRKYI